MYVHIYDLRVLSNQMNFQFKLEGKLQYTTEFNNPLYTMHFLLLLTSKLTRLPQIYLSILEKLNLMAVNYQ